mmetsp:Transcript_16389/g.46781  ORF Transcript_16389/g.46781 Transcript_16389/m.46781 type:complete len:220 (-) Transcript_16389:1594-2253(-)
MRVDVQRLPSCLLLLRFVRAAIVRLLPPQVVRVAVQRLPEAPGLRGALRPLGPDEAIEDGGRPLQGLQALLHKGPGSLLLELVLVHAALLRDGVHDGLVRLLAQRALPREVLLVAIRLLLPNLFLALQRVPQRGAARRARLVLLGQEVLHGLVLTPDQVVQGRVAPLPRPPLHGQELARCRRARGPVSLKLLLGLALEPALQRELAPRSLHLPVSQLFL